MPYTHLNPPQHPGPFISCVVAFQAANDPRLKEAAEIMSIPVIGGGVGSWGNNGNEAEENQMVSLSSIL